MNHIKQVIKLEIVGNIKNKKKEVTQKTIFSGFFEFSRCIRKSGQLVKANQIGFALFEDIDVSISLQEKLKYGGYRCITMRVFDAKGGDYVENQDLSIVVCEANKTVPLAEVSNRIPLCASPEGLFKRIDIGVNNYDPSIFSFKEFTIYFLRDSMNYEELLQGDEGIMIQTRSEADIFKERLDKDLVAFGNFSAEDLIKHSLHQDEFSHISVGFEETEKKTSGGPKNLKEAKKAVSKAST